MRTSFLGSIYLNLLKNKIIPGIHKAGLTPNQLTVLGTVFAILVPFGFFIHPIGGLLFISASGIADSLDGLLARDQKQVSNFGAFLDSSLDRLSDFFYLSGFWILFWLHGYMLPASVMMFFALLFTLMISYVKARAEALGVQCPVGLMERSVRVIYLLAWALILSVFPRQTEQLLWAGFLVYCGLTLTTVAQRMLHIRKKLNAERPPEV